MGIIEKEKKNFDFVDTIRCISMIGIVFEHCTVIGDPYYTNFSSSLLQASVMQFFKFATIAFFLIAGFLINHKFTEYTPWEYLKNRFRSTIKPWAFWLNVMVLINLFGLFLRYLRHGSADLPPRFFSYLIEEYRINILFTSFWFILNFLICIAILLIFKKYLYKLWFGFILAIVSLFYSVNLYHGWVATNHTMAIFGFVFYLWLGVMMNRYYGMLSLWLSKISIWQVLTVTLLLFFLSDLEIVYLKHLKIDDAYNTLRISNILYSLSFFVLLLKIGPISFVNKYLSPRRTTFGIYLIHPIILTYLITEIFRPFKFDLSTMPLLDGTMYTVLRFLILYLVSVGLVFLISKTRLRWSIGML